MRLSQVKQAGFSRQRENGPSPPVTHPLDHRALGRRRVRPLLPLDRVRVENKRPVRAPRAPAPAPAAAVPLQAAGPPGPARQMHRRQRRRRRHDTPQLRERAGAGAGARQRALREAGRRLGQRFEQAGLVLEGQQRIVFPDYEAGRLPGFYGAVGLARRRECGLSRRQLDGLPAAAGAAGGVEEGERGAARGPVLARGVVGVLGRVG
jgi:hypothetical protein